MSAILFYSPFDQRSRDTETLMIAFKKQGHRVMSLSQASGTQIHDYLQTHGIETYTHVLSGRRGFFYYLRHMFFFVSFCRRNKVDVVYSHLEPANVVSAVGQYFIRSKVFIVRHHIDEARLLNFDRSFFYRMTYSVARNVIVVSKQAKDYMVTVEKADPEKIIHINLAYDFSLYAPPQKTISRTNAVTLLTACRFTKYKRPELAIEVLKQLKSKGINARLILLGRGEDEKQLATLLHESGLANDVLMPGYVSNITDYMAASDFLLHPSVLESSCVVVKEAALTQLPVIVCKGIGDFDDYIENEKNGFVVNKDEFVTEATRVVQQFMQTDMTNLTANLNKKVKEIFGIDSIIQKYETLNN